MEDEKEQEKEDEETQHRWRWDRDDLDSVLESVDVLVKRGEHSRWCPTVIKQLVDRSSFPRTMAQIWVPGKKPLEMKVLEVEFDYLRPSRVIHDVVREWFGIYGQLQLLKNQNDNKCRRFLYLK